MTYINMAVACWVYIAGLYGYEFFAQASLPDDFRSASVTGLSVVSVILFYIAWWHRTHPAVYEAMITKERFVVSYPNVPQWSFDIRIGDIKRFESRNTLSHAGEGIMQHGILLKDGTFHHISMNYGNNINEMYRAVHSVNPEVTFPKRVNLKVFGPLARDYRE